MPEKLITSPAWVAAVAVYVVSVVDALVTQTYSPGYLAIMAIATYYLFGSVRLRS